MLVIASLRIYIKLEYQLKPGSKLQLQKLMVNQKNKLLISVDTGDLMCLGKCQRTQIAGLKFHWEKNYIYKYIYKQIRAATLDIEEIPMIYDYYDIDKCIYRKKKKTYLNLWNQYQI